MSSECTIDKLTEIIVEYEKIIGGELVVAILNSSIAAVRSVDQSLKMKREINKLKLDHRQPRTKIARRSPQLNSFQETKPDENKIVEVVEVVEVVETLKETLPNPLADAPLPNQLWINVVNKNRRKPKPKPKPIQSELVGDYVSDFDNGGDDYGNNRYKGFCPYFNQQLKDLKTGKVIVKDGILNGCQCVERNNHDCVYTHSCSICYRDTHGEAYCFLKACRPYNSKDGCNPSPNHDCYKRHCCNNCGEAHPKHDCPIKTCVQYENNMCNDDECSKIHQEFNGE